MEQRTLVDLRNLMDPDVVTAQGFRYEGVGRRRLSATGPVAVQAAG